jgi:two-component system, chemotaxis family, chemotaxis protein CheY
MAKDSKILLVDDSAFMRSVLKNILEADGFKNFVEAEDGDDALKKISSEKPDLILLDIIMPGKGGMDVLKEVGDKVKIIVISAVGQEKVVSEAKEAGAVGYIVKPFDNNQVLEEINKAIS